jgi:S-disulfanyl-L-cysteine oxidoreductase SoxD
MALLQQNACVDCHAMDATILGPSFSAIGEKHAGKGDCLLGKITAGRSGVWGAVPMPAQNLPEADAKMIADWLAAGAGAAPGK